MTDSSKEISAQCSVDVLNRKKYIFVKGSMKATLWAMIMLAVSEI